MNSMKIMAIILAASVILPMISCSSSHEQNDTDQVTIDTIDIEEPMQVTGVAIDGAMNSVYLKVGDDTIEFTYPDLDSDQRAAWEIDDTLTIRYFATQNGDSVTQVINHSDA